MTSLRKNLILNSDATLKDRIRALRELNPSRRFLERIIGDLSIPGKVRAAASEILLEIENQTPQEPSKPEPLLEPSHVPSILGREPVLGTELAGEIDAELYDILDGGVGVRGCTRGPDHAPVVAATVEHETKPHTWRREKS